MIKRAILALMLMAAATCAQAAGTVAFSLSQQLDQYGNPLNGCLLYTIQAGTTSTPQNSYKDTALTLLQPNPLVCDAFGRLPQFFLADGQIKLRLTDKNGGAVLTQDNILVIGPSSGGGGGGSIDPTTIFTTGDVKIAYGTQTITGWVRLNGRTIGSATSGATERANADTQALFQYFWTTDTTLAVSGGRGASSIADWTANKAITLPDGRGRTMAGLDDMGNSAAGRLTATYFGATGGCSGALGTTLGATCGGESQTLTLPQLPAITSSGINSISVTPGANSVPVAPGGFTIQTGSISVGAGAATIPYLSGTSWGSTGNMAGSNNISVTSSGTSGSPHPQVQPTMLITYYIKL
jgi:hypothetical protein